MPQCLVTTFKLLINFICCICRYSEIFRTNHDHRISLFDSNIIYVTTSLNFYIMSYCGSSLGWGAGEISFTSIIIAV